MTSSFDDFGFTVHDESEFITQDNTQEIYNLVSPLLENLINAKGDVIKWPMEKRKSELSSLLEKMKQLTKG